MAAKHPRYPLGFTRVKDGYKRPQRPLSSNFQPDLLKPRLKTTGAAEVQDYERKYGLARMGLSPCKAVTKADNSYSRVSRSVPFMSFLPAPRRSFCSSSCSNGLTSSKTRKGKLSGCFYDLHLEACRHVFLRPMAGDCIK